MNGQDPLAEFFASSPRHESGLSGRSGIHGQVDAALEELRVPATLDQDGDWKLQTDVGPFLLIVDEESSDLVVIQTIQSMEKKVEQSADEMHLLLALNFEHRGLARFGAVKDSGQNLLVITARIGSDAVSTDGVRDLLADCMRLSRRVDELLGNAPEAGPEAEAGAGQPQAPPAEPPAAELAPPADAPPAADAPPSADDVIPMSGAPTVFGTAPVASPEPEPAPVQPEPAPAQYAPPAQPAAPLPPPPQPQLPPANWYPDPHGQARLRYWDGQQWTGHVAN